MRKRAEKSSVPRSVATNNQQIVKSGAKSAAEHSPACFFLPFPPLPQSKRKFRVPRSATK
jgi:hypothetical protein